MTVTDPTFHFSDEAKKYDYDRWLTALFALAACRDAIFTLIAFNGEIARIRETVSEPLLGDIRLQWWRDALTGIAKGAPTVHPLVKALAGVIPACNLDIELLQRMIDIRARDLDPAPFATTAELLDYADGTGGILNSLSASVAGLTSTEGLEAARQVGRAFALTGIIRAIPYHARQDLLLIPADLLARQGLTAETVFVPENRAAFLNVVADLEACAEQEQKKALSLIKVRPATEKQAFRLARLTSLYLPRLRAAGFDPGHRKMEVGALRKITALLTGR
ncbi:MAG: squalene/phytoene synthase family protein [Sneathiella sp.]|nr:squalene/phytoene synthase family protein [Sneathiella sp.]